MCVFGRCAYEDNVCLFFVGGGEEGVAVAGGVRRTVMVRWRLEGYRLWDGVGGL